MFEMLFAKEAQKILVQLPRHTALLIRQKLKQEVMPMTLSFNLKTT